MAITCFVASFSLIYISCLLLQKVVLFENPYRYNVTDFKRQSRKMVRHTQAGRLLPTNCLIVFDHFVGLVLKGLKLSNPSCYWCWN